MGRKAKRREAEATVRQPKFRVDPFADLRAKAAAALPPARPPPPPRPAPKPAPGPQLDAEDRKLLEAFKEGGSVEFRTRAEQVRMELLRRSGGKAITCVRGLRGLSVLDLMEVTATLRQQFGMVARFRENVLEVEGDERVRLSPWLVARGYAVAGPGGQH